MSARQPRSQLSHRAEPRVPQTVDDLLVAVSRWQNKSRPLEAVYRSRCHNDVPIGGIALIEQANAPPGFLEGVGEPISCVIEIMRYEDIRQEQSLWIEARSNRLSK